MHLHNRRKPVIFSVLLLLLLPKCVFACMCHCECVFEWDRAELCLNKAGHGSCTWPLLINRRSTTNDRTFSFFRLSSFTLKEKKNTAGSRNSAFKLSWMEMAKNTWDSEDFIWKVSRRLFSDSVFQTYILCQILQYSCWIGNEPLNFVQ